NQYGGDNREQYRHKDFFTDQSGLQGNRAQNNLKRTVCIHAHTYSQRLRCFQSADARTNRSANSFSDESKNKDYYYQRQTETRYKVEVKPDRHKEQGRKNIVDKLMQNFLGAFTHVFRIA